MDIAILICCAIIIVLLIVLLIKSGNPGANRDNQETEELKKQIEFLRQSNESQNKLLMDQAVRQSETMVKQISVLGDSLRDILDPKNE